MDTHGFIYPFVACLLLSSFAAQTSASTARFDRAFQRFLVDNGYRGGAVAAMKDGRLLITKGYGLDRGGEEVTAHTRFPVSSVAKSMTAAGVMRLVQEGKLNLDDTVFGENGILYDITPFGKKEPDERLYDVTVEHLLRHTAGWDSENGPLLDPIYNEVYLQRGHQVPNIAKEMNTATPLNPVELIRYVMSQPLNFNPGTKVVYSNFGYLVLGRVIEAVSKWDYIDYVKRAILNPCGMWKTRIEPPLSSWEQEEGATFDPSILDSLDPEAVDSTLGWYSNVYDMMRFTRCLFDTNTLLDDRHLEILLARPRAPPVQHKQSWDCAGFRTSTKNLVWQDADKHADDLILYHNLNPRGNTVDTLLHSGSGRAADLPDSWVVLLFDKNINRIRHYTRELMANLESAAEMEMPGYENLFLFDLSELHAHPMWEPPTSLLVPEFSVHYKVDEHHVTAYVRALRDEGFTIHSLSTLTQKDHTTFLVVARRVTTTARVDSDFMFEHGMDYRHLLKKKLTLEAAGYNMTLLHSYKSKSHYHHLCFAAVFRYEAFTPSMQMKYGTNHLPEPYQKLVQMYHEKEFYPLSQTVIYHGKEERFSFIFVKRPRSIPVHFEYVSDLSAKRLSKVTAEYMRKEMPLSYLNAYEVNGRFRFSAVFSNGTNAPGTFEIEQPQNRATEITISNLNDRLAPKQMVPYIGDDKELKIATFYQEV